MMIKPTPLVTLARAVATRSLRGKFRRDGFTPAILHSAAVAERMDTDAERAVAWLHDVLEDTETTADDLRAVGIPQEIVDHVVRMTRLPDEPYPSYLVRVNSHEVTRRVKIQDNIVNMSDTPTRRQIIRYAKSLLFLHGEPTPTDWS